MNEKDKWLSTGKGRVSHAETSLVLTLNDVGGHQGRCVVITVELTAGQISFHLGEEGGNILLRFHKRLIKYALRTYHKNGN